MNKKTVILLAISAIQALAADNTYTLDALSVTAYRDEENIFVQPHSIDVKKNTEVNLDQVISQRDLLNSISGVRIEQTNDGSGHMTSVRMPLNTNPYYLFLQDGIPVQSSGFFNHNGLAFTSYGLANSVEVLKGAGTALYGSDAVAATINVISAVEPSKTPTSSVRMDGGSDGYGAVAVENSATIDLKNAYRVGAKYNHNDSWREHNTLDRFELNGRYDYVVNNDNMIKILVSGAKTDGEQADDFSNYENIENGSTAASDDSAYYTALTKTDIRRKYDMARLSAEWTNYAFKDVEISLTPYVRYNRNRYVATWESNLPSNDSTQRTVGLLEKTTFDQKWGRFIVGFDTEYTKADQINNQDFTITTGFPPKTYAQGSLYDYSVDYFAIAPFVHSDYKINNELTLSAGARLDYNQYEYNNNLSVGADASNTYDRPADRSDNFSHVSPKLSLSYQPSEDLNLYARYANGFRIPQATQLYSKKTNTQVTTLNPEASNTYEIGMKKRYGKHFVEISGYYMSIDNTITRYPINNSTYYYDNGGATINKGIEASTSLVLTDELEAKIAYSYSTHKYENDPAYKDNDMAAAPRNMANTRLFYSLFSGMKLMGEWQYVGSYWMDNENTQKYNGYSIGNLKADYKIRENISLFGKVNNITDKRYATRATLDHYGTRNVYNYTPGDPRQFFAGLEYIW